MARLSTSSGNPSSDTTAVNLNRLLARLQKSLLRPDSVAEHRLRSSSYERSRVRANIDYAKSLLLQLEQDSLNIRVLSKKQDVQADLLHKRDVILRLNERLEELQALGEANPDDDTSEGEDLLGEDTPSDDVDEQHTPSDSHFLASSISSAGAGAGVDQPSPLLTPPSTSDREPDREQEEPEAPQRDDPPNSSSGLRSRHNPNIPTTISQDTGISTSSSTTTTKNSPLPPTSKVRSTSPSLATTAATESLLSHQRHEQEALTNSLLSMAQQLKTSSQSIAQTLESEKGILDAATEGLAKNTSGMEAASKRMGVLRRMSEGKGWLGRMMLYAWIFGLMVVAVLIVFVGPKLRF